jgi:uncharacterized delta-60 repeat protein
VQIACESLEPRRLFAAGDQDLTYGDNGFLRLRFADAAYQFMPGSDPAGTATVVAMSADSATFSLRRFIAGVADATAGPNGTIATIPLPFDVPAGKRAAPARIWNLSGGRTLVEFLVANRITSAEGYYVRLNADRSLDTTYGSGGVAYVPGGFWLDAVQQGDKFVALREASTPYSTVARYTDEFELDATFGNGGISRPGERMAEITAQPDGKIVLATWDVARVVRLTSGGLLDPTFAGDGIAETGILQNSTAIAVDAAGRIVVSGSGSITRLTSAGATDTTFGTNGTITPDIPFTDAILPDGTVLPGTGGTPIEFGMVLRVTPGGQFDADFGHAFVSLGMFEPLLDRTVEVLRDPQVSTPQPDGSVLVSRRFVDGRFVQVRLEDGGAAPGVVTLAGGVMTVAGTNEDDHILINPLGGAIGTRQGVGRSFDPDLVTAYRVDALGGDDIVVVREDDPAKPAVIFGGLGDDRLAGDRGNDTIFGNAGNDRIEGYGGDDLLHGNGGRDKLSGGPKMNEPGNSTAGDDRIFGDEGDDSLAGEGGADILDGGTGNDRLDGGDGADRMMGSDGNDTFVSNGDENAVDDLYGGGGTDTLLAGDEDDLLTDIETT